MHVEPRFDPEYAAAGADQTSADVVAEDDGV